METEEENDARVQEQRPPFTGITQQTVYQHESHITAWLPPSEDSFIVTNTNTAVWSGRLRPPRPADRSPVLQSGPDQPSRHVLFPL